MVARVQLQQLEDIGNTLEEKLNELSMRALTQQLHSLLASSKALRLQGQMEGPYTPGAELPSDTSNGSSAAAASASGGATSAPSSPQPASGAMAGAPAAVDVASGSAAPSQS